MNKRTRRNLQIALLVVIALILLNRLPSYSFVSVSGPNGTTVVEHAGPGPHKVRVEGADGSFAESGGW